MSGIWAERAEFYQEHLNRVSRSFAFCIERLESPLRAHVGLSYLLCRILDTVEDALWPSRAHQEAAFDRFESFIRVCPAPEEVGRWRSTFPDGIPEGEVRLMDQAWEMFRDFHGLSVRLQESLRGPILSMARGMRFFQKRVDRGEMKLKNLGEVNQYCFFVAGVVGEILTQLLCADTAIEERELTSPGLDLENSFRFGLFLQKVNLLKDQMGDEKEGRYLVPSRPGVRASLIEDAKGALRYLLSIPESIKGYRLFCGWSLFLGLASLPWIDRSWRERALIKIPRARTLLLLAEIERKIRDNKALERLFEKLLSESGTEPAFSPASLAQDSSVDAIHPLMELYQGALTKDQVATLMSA